MHDGIDRREHGVYGIGVVHGIVIRGQPVRGSARIGRLGELDLVDLFERIQVEDQNVITDAYLVPVFQRGLPDPDVVDEDSVVAAEILDEKTFPFPAQDGVMSGHAAPLENDGIVRGAAQRVACLDQRHVGGITGRFLDP